MSDGENVVDLSDPQLISRSNDEKVSGRETMMIDRSAEEIVFQRLNALTRRERAEERGCMSERGLAKWQRRSSGVFSGLALVEILDLGCHSHLEKGEGEEGESVL